MLRVRDIVGVESRDVGKSRDTQAYQPLGDVLWQIVNEPQIVGLGLIGIGDGMATF